MFQSILHAIGATIVTTGLFVAGLFGYSPDQNAGATNPIPDTPALFSTSLASPITSSATSLTLVSASYNNGGSTLASSTYGFILDEGTSVEEIVLADCTSTTCTNITRGIDRLTGSTTVSALQFAHRRGASVKVTDAPIIPILKRIINGEGNFPNVVRYSSNKSIATSSNEFTHASWVSGAANVASTSALATIRGSVNTFTLAQTFSALATFTSGFTAMATSTLSNGALLGYSIGTLSDNLAVANKSYVDGVAIAGASDANLTTKGIVETASKAEVAAGTKLGGTGAFLFIPSEYATSTSQVATTSVVITNTSGKIDPSFLNGSGEQYTLQQLLATNATTTTFAATATSTTVIGSFPAYHIGKHFQAFTSTGTTTFSVPSGVTKVHVRLVGGGLTGATCSSGGGTGGTGGKGGGYAEKFVDVTGTTTIQVYVGAAGEWTTFGTNGFYFKANIDGTTTGGDWGVDGFQGGTGFGISASVAVGGYGGHSLLGSGASATVGDAVGGAASVGYGGGGGGGACPSGGGSNRAGGVGRQGAIFINW